MDFEKMTLGELLALDTSEFTPAQELDWATAIRSKRAGQPPASQQASPIEEWREGVTPDGRRYLQDPLYPKNVRWLGDTPPTLRDTPEGTKRWDPESESLVPVPGGEKGDPIDIAWKSNLDRIEQQQRINKLREGDRPDAPSLSTTAEWVYEWDPEQKRWVAKKNINYRPGGTGQARETAEEAYAKDRAKWRAEIEAVIEKKQWEYENGYVQKPAELQAIKDMAERAIKELDYKYSVALAEEQSRQRMSEWKKTEEPYKEAAERRAQAGEERAGAQLRMGALEKQAEVGQGIIQQAVKAGVYHKVPDAGRMLRFAFDPVLEAAAIAKRLSPQQPQGVPLAPVEGVPLAPVR